VLRNKTIARLSFIDVLQWLSDMLWYVFLPVENCTSCKKLPFERLDTNEYGWVWKRCRLFVWK